jgi:hypothetical protein
MSTTSLLFKTIPPVNLFTDFLLKTATETNPNSGTLHQCRFSKEEYKRLQIGDGLRIGLRIDLRIGDGLQMEPSTLATFMNELTPYYHLSKAFYTAQPWSFTSLMVIFRQLSKLHGIPFEKKMLYAKSTYDIEYLFSFKVNVS